MTRFLSLQIFAAACEKQGHAVLYQLSSPHINYVGSTSFGVKRFGCSGSSPVTRAYQHILEHKLPPRANVEAPCPMKRKCRLFRAVRVCDHMFWVLKQGPEIHIRCRRRLPLLAGSRKATVSLLAANTFAEHVGPKLLVTTVRAPSSELPQAMRFGLT